jgi:4-diphosphocytidyl-2-C-methyl-D-erythritol kinase
MVIFPNCKINLGLNIISKRPDGFHNIETVFYPVALHDSLEAIVAGDGVFEFHTSGLAIPGDPAKNLCVKAYQLLEKDFRLPAVNMHLHKVIPMGAGLGGGSSDGAFALKLLNDMFSLGLNNAQLTEYARLLGSDCSFFIENQPCHAFEKGDKVEPVEVDLSGLELVVVVPGVHVSTPEAYSAITPAIPDHLPAKVVNLPVGKWKSRLMNDFEKTVFQKYPVIGDIKQNLYKAGALYASMSGSGSAVYGLFEETPRVNDLFPGNFIWCSPRP